MVFRTENALYLKYNELLNLRINVDASFPDCFQHSHEAQPSYRT